MGGRDAGAIDAHDQHAVAHLDARCRRQVLRRPRRLHDRRRLAAYRRGIQNHASTARGGWGREPVRHPHRRHRSRRPVGLFRPQVHVHRRDDHFHDLPGASGGKPELLLARRLPVRTGGRARLRLSDRPPDHFGEHPKQHARAPGARCFRLPGLRRNDWNRRGISCAQEHSRDRRLALDVRDGDHSRLDRHDQSFLYHGERPLAAGPGPTRRGEDAIGSASGALADLSKERRVHDPGGHRRIAAELSRAVRQNQFAGHRPRLCSMVSSGPRDLWHWNFYAYDPRRLDRSQDRPCTEPRRPHHQ